MLALLPWGSAGYPLTALDITHGDADEPFSLLILSTFCSSPSGRFSILGGMPVPEDFHLTVDRVIIWIIQPLFFPGCEVDTSLSGHRNRLSWDPAPQRVPFSILTPAPQQLTFPENRPGGLFQVTLPDIQELLL